MSGLYGKYRLLERISSSQVAEVFRAKSHGVEGFEKMVVIKRLRSRVARVDGYVQAFVEEAKAAVRLSHANLVQVFDLGQVDGSFYLAMEHVNGPDLGALTLHSRDKGQPLPVDLAIHLVCELVKALDYTHRRKDYQLRPLGLVHGGVHPWSVLVSTDGEVKLTNFGAQRLRALLPEPMQPPDAASLPYLAPELRAGMNPGQTADTYAAGIILHELLVGAPPAEGAGAARLREVAGAPPELEGIVGRALAADPGQRYERSGDLYEALVAMLFHAGLRPNNRALGVFVRGLVAEPLPEDLLRRGRQRPHAGQAPERPVTAALPAVVVHGPAAGAAKPSPAGAASASTQRIGTGAPHVGDAAAPRRAQVVDADPVRAVPALTAEVAAAPALPPQAAGSPPSWLPATPPPLPAAQRPAPPAAVGPPPPPAHALPPPLPAGLWPSAPPAPPARPGPPDPAAGAPATPPEDPLAMTWPDPDNGEGLLPGVPPRLVELGPGSALRVSPAAPPPASEGSLATGRSAAGTSESLIEAAILCARAVAERSAPDSAELLPLFERWGGEALLAPEGWAMAVFQAASLPARAVARATHCGLQAAELGGQHARWGLGVHGGSIRLERGPEGTWPAPDDPAAARARDLAEAAAPGELLSSEIGPMLLAGEFGFSGVLQLAGKAQVHRVLPPMLLTTPAGARLLEATGSRVLDALQEPVGVAGLKGRDPEIDILLREIEALGAERGAALTVRGAAGVGKSALLGAVRARVAGEDTAWFHVRLGPGRQGVPYAGLRSLVATICGADEDLPMDELRSRLERLVQLGLSEVDLAGVASVFSLQRRGSSWRRVAPALGQMGQGDSRALLGGVVRKVLSGLAAERPTVLALDGVEYLDPESWDLLRGLLRELSQHRLLVILAARTGDRPPGLDELRGLSLDVPPVEELRRKLKRIGRLYDGAAAPESLLDAVLAWSQGNPRAAEEMLRWLGESEALLAPGLPAECPADLAGLVALRLGSLPEAEREILDAAAVVGPSFDLDLLGRVLRIDPGPLDEGLRHLQRRGMVEPVGRQRCAFRHDLLRSAALRELPEDTRRSLHGRVAAQVEALHPEDRERFLDELAAHHGAAGNSRKAQRYLEAVAERLAAEHHYRAAIERMQVAWDLLDADPRADSRHRIEVLRRIGELSLPAMEFELGRRALGQALELAQRARQERDLARCLLLLGRSWLAEGSYDEALDHLKRALRLAQGLRDPALMAGIYGAIGEAYNKNEDLVRAVDYLRRGVALAEREGDRGLAGRLALLQASSHAAQGEFGPAERMLDKANQLAGRSEDLSVRCAVLKTRSLVGFFQGDHGAALDAALEGADLAQAIGALAEEVVFLHNAGDCCMRLGDLGRSHHYLSLSLERSQSHGLLRYQVTNEILLAYLEGLQAEDLGDSARQERALAALRTSLHRAEDLHFSWERIQAHLYWGKLALRWGRRDEARDELQVAAEEARRIHLRFASDEAEALLRELDAQVAPPPLP